ncbi:MAG: M48 family metalloprotease [bacterium]
MRCRAILILLLILTGCATTRLQPVGKDVKFEEDEKRLWTRAEEEQDVLDNGGLLYKDQALEAYINEVARKLQSKQVYSVIPFRVKVILNPYLNAFAYPNGAVYVHTGILARMDNEAQLATLLAHEMTHATHRHGVSSFRSVKNKTAFLASMQGTVGVVPVLGDLATQLGAIGTMASVSGHSRDQETESDIVGLRLMTNAGYDPREAPKLFIHLKNELAEEKMKEPFFFGTHPRIKERIENYEGLLKTEYAGKKGALNRDIFIKKTQAMILDNAQLDLKGGRFSVAQRGIEKYLSIKPNDAKAYYLLGETMRQRGEKGDLEKAKEYYQKAVASNASYAASYKGMALVSMKKSERGQAKKYFESYLSLSPNASDRAYIEEYIKECGKGGKQ